jgi:two-component system nitrate/nitrite response regulator NarL
VSVNTAARLGDPLTPREDQVLLALADGLRVPEIADELHLSRETVMTHSNTLRVKLGARNATHAVALAYHRRLLNPAAVAA